MLSSPFFTSSKVNIFTLQLLACFVTFLAHIQNCWLVLPSVLPITASKCKAVALFFQNNHFYTKQTLLVGRLLPYPPLKSFFFFIPMKSFSSLFHFVPPTGSQKHQKCVRENIRGGCGGLPPEDF